MPVQACLRSASGSRLIIFTARELNFPFLGVLHDCLRQRMLGVRVNSGGNAQDFLVGFSVPRNHLLDARFSLRDRARLVHRESFQFSDFFEERSALDENAAPGHRGQTRHDGDRR